MNGDFSRRTFDATKHYSAVLVEQGRLLTDADSEEEHRILTHRTERATGDVIGPCGGPQPTAGFALSAPTDEELRFGAGPYYVGGTLLENEVETAFTEQPDRFDVSWPPAPGRHAVVLESRRRLVTALDDPSIREVALGGPTTSSRERVVWQIHTVPVADEWSCTDELPEAERTTGQLAARAEPDEEQPSPCLIPPQAGYTGLENQFYRVEVLDSGEAHDLGSAPDTIAVTGFPAGHSNRLVVAELGPLAVGDGVEVFRAGPGSDPVEATFGHVTGIDGTTLTLSTSLPAFGPADAPRLRRAGAAFVVSRDNGSVVTAVEAIDGLEVTVHDLGPDDVLGFAVGHLVELSDDRTELEGLPRQLREIADLDRTRHVVVLRTPADPLDAGPTGVDPARHPKLRRWDGAGAVRFHPDGTAWVHLENGIQVRFVDGHYRLGDHWTFPARAAEAAAGSGTIEWPQDGGAPALRPPFGIERHRCLLGHVDLDPAGRITGFQDCRALFPPLTRLRSLRYVGGEGQEGLPDPADPGSRSVALPEPIQVRVSNGSLPVAGATVRFTISDPGNGRLQDTDDTTADVGTDGTGLASCVWHLDGATPHQVCEARLLDQGRAPLDDQVVRFGATLSTASRVAYDPRDCPGLQENGVRTVQQAIDVLCRQSGADLPRITRTSWSHAGVMSASEFLERGLVVRFDRPIRPPEGPPIGWFLVSVEYDRSRFEADPNEVFVRRINPQRVEFRDDGQQVSFRPFRNFAEWADRTANTPEEVLCRVVLKSHVLLDEAGGALDGDFLAGSLPTGNGTAGGDFESWFTLVVRE